MCSERQEVFPLECQSSVTVQPRDVCPSLPPLTSALLASTPWALEHALGRTVYHGHGCRLTAR